MANRRAFIKNTATAGCALLLLGAPFASCTKLPIVKTQVTNKSIVVDESALVEGNRWIVRAPQLDYDLLLVRTNGGGYRCLLMRCTHQDFPVRLAGDTLVCNTHGSRFDLEGNVMKDPATKPLTQLPVTQNQSKVIITV